MILFFLIVNSFFVVENYKKELIKPNEESSDDIIYEGDYGYDAPSVSASSNDEDFPKNEEDRKKGTMSSSEAIANKIEKINKMKDLLNEGLSLDDDDMISGIHDKKAWNELYEFLKLNINDFMVDGHLMIQLQIKYIMCCFIIMFLPANFAFFFPAAYNKLLPKKIYKISVIGDALKEFEKFLSFVKSKHETSFITTFYFGRKNSLLEDLEFVSKIPDKIFSDPVYIFRELLGFEITSDGYLDYKNKL
ncbi:hypothetical protein TCON_2247 [Astathelohania contejeani]|uniref:Uncharacterized protein n=1 Tax=Astathelohania contejeani TaxID=164912 RepID=A0ABQ7HWJ9_9MICR|nr:hypothetical protein TCON_2247 [Thelohania contejeani]